MARAACRRLQGLQTKIVLNGHDDPVQFVLEHGTRNLPDGEGLLKIRDLLVDDGVTAVEGESDARTIVERTRRWAVAEWFVDEGLDKACSRRSTSQNRAQGSVSPGSNSGRC